MNSLVKTFFLTCVLVVVTSKPITEEEKNAMIGQMVGKCKAEEGASDSDVQDAMEYKPPTSRPAQCFHACMMESIGVLKDSKVSVEGSIKIAEMSGDPTKVKNSEAVAKECQNVGGGDRCDSIPEILQCVATASAKLGITPKDLH